MSFHYRGLECKSRKSRNTGSNRHFGLGVQKEAGQRLTEFCQENALVIENTKNPNNGESWELWEELAKHNFSKVMKYPWESLECDTKRFLSMGWAGRYRSLLETQLTT